MMNREAFEQWYMSLHGSDINDLALWGKDSPWYSKDDYELISTRNMYQAWQAATDAQQAKIDALIISTETAWRHAEQAQNDRKHYGVHLAAALKGEKHKDEPVDQRLDAVRELVARNAEFTEWIWAVSQNSYIPHLVQKSARILLEGGAK